MAEGKTQYPRILCALRKFPGMPFSREAEKKTERHDGVWWRLKRANVLRSELSAVRDARAPEENHFTKPRGAPRARAS